MNSENLLSNIINENLKDINDIIDCLYTTSNACEKNRLLNQLRKSISNFSMLVQGLHTGENTNNPQLNDVRLFTTAELTRYNGRDGNPAYVAVNGMVYDVTNNAAWGGATHFGLAAGTDVTSQFASCHAGQSILSKLKVVGKMTG